MGSATQSTRDFTGKLSRRLKIYLKATVGRNISGRSNGRSKGVEVMKEQGIFRISKYLWCDWDEGIRGALGCRRSRFMNHLKCHAK